MHCNANYATGKLEAQKYGQHAKTSRPKSICMYSLIIHLEISIQNISLVLSCEPHPKCKLKETDNCINKLVRAKFCPRVFWILLDKTVEELTMFSSINS